MFRLNLTVFMEDFWIQMQIFISYIYICSLPDTSNLCCEKWPSPKDSLLHIVIGEHLNNMMQFVFLVSSFTSDLFVFAVWCYMALNCDHVHFRSPDTSRVKAKMIYASSKDRFRRELDGVHYELQATDASEMDIHVIRDRANWI